MSVGGKTIFSSSEKQQNLHLKKALNFHQNLLKKMLTGITLHLTTMLSRLPWLKEMLIFSRKHPKVFGTNSIRNDDPSSGFTLMTLQSGTILMSLRHSKENF